MKHVMGVAALQAEVATYVAAFPEDAEALRPLIAQLERGEDVCDRRNFTGHVTGAGIVLSPDHSQVLLVHHKLRDRWQQPGGHAEPQDKTMLEAAIREIVEETGVRIARLVPISGKVMPIHICADIIPANLVKQELEHWHYDFRYVFEAASLEVQHQELEAHAAQWFSLDAPETAHIAVALTRLAALRT